MAPTPQAFRRGDASAIRFESRLDVTARALNKAFEVFAVGAVVVPAEIDNSHTVLADERKA
jgi:hypothetical protein